MKKKHYVNIFLIKLMTIQSQNLKLLNQQQLNK
jgi:hypothetical protein